MFLENGLRKKSTVATNGTTSAEHTPVVSALTGAVKVTATPVLTVAGAYSIGDCVGTVLALANVTGSAGGSVILQSVQVKDQDNAKSGLEILLFSDNPAAGAYTDNSAPAFDAGGLDWAKYAGRVTVLGGDYLTIGGKADANEDGIGKQIQVVGTTLYMLVISDGTPTYTAGSLTITARFLRADN